MKLFFSESKMIFKILKNWSVGWFYCIVIMIMTAIISVGHRDVTVNHKISKCNKRAQKDFKSRHNCLGKVNY